MNIAVIETVDRVTPTTVTIRFPWVEEVEAGQFIMVWLPGKGEIPISLSHLGDLKGITVKKYGATSEALTNIQRGQRLYFRGPYGSGFHQTTGRSLIVGGGSGMAGLLPLVKKDSYGVVSASTKKELLFADSFRKDHLTLVTDDGSAGIMGVALDGLKTLDLDHYDKMYVCGPELMLKSILDYVADKNLAVDFSMERMMKCGIGVCDSCSINGLQLCKDGPVFDKSAVASMSEFGRYRLTESGTRMKL